MNDLLHEQLSALIDGELPAAETALLLKRLGREPELRRRLASYRVCGETLRGERVRVRSEFTLKLAAVMADEPAHALVARPRRAAAATLRFLKPLAGLAVAASVAGAAILVMGRPSAPGAGIPLAQQAPPAPAAAAQPFAARNTPRSLSASNSFSAEPASYTTPAQRPALATIPQSELTKYALAHSEVSGPLGLHSLLTSLVADEDGGTPAR